MHIKHYHPALLKKLGCKTLRVEDLAAARTAFEADEIKPSVYSQSILSVLLTPPPQSPVVGEKKADRSIDSPVSEDLLNVPLSKRVTSLIQGDSCVKPTTSPSATNAKSIRRRAEKASGLNPSEEVEEASSFENVLPALYTASPSEREVEDADVRKMEKDVSKTEATVPLSVLDDIPGQKELVHCFCGSPEEDGLMIQCELCLCWQHGICLGIDTEEGVPDPYVCHFCRYPYRERLSQRYSHDQTWLKKGNLYSLKFVTGTSSVVGGPPLRAAHGLAAAASDLKQLLHSLKVKIDIAK
jgi:PHD-finger